MLTPDQTDILRESAGRITAPVTEYLLRDIARRVAEAGRMTSTASYQIWRAQQLGVSQREIKRELRRLLGLSHQEIRRIFYQSAQSGYSLDVSRFPYVQSLSFERNAVLQQITAAAVELAQEDFSNIVQTIGFVNPFGKPEPLTQVYISSCDFAFQLVSTGAASYTKAIRQATRHLAAKGVRVIDYESGVHTSLEAAVRRNIMGGLGLMQERVSQTVHDQLGCDGWEITAHANSAPDHEPIQGRQYSDAAYQELNGSLRRRIGTLNCGHAAFPVMLGVNSPQYTPKELEKLRSDNEKGVIVDGVHYTGYQATQMQRALERAIRRQKQRITVDEGAGDREKLKQDKTRLTILHQRYREFSRAAGLRTQYERTEVAGFGEKLVKNLENPTRSGIIEPNRSEEIPEVQKASTPLPLRAENVTEEYLRAATPGSHVVQDLRTYEVNGVTYVVDGRNVVLDYSPHEKEIAELLEQTLGGEIFMVPRINNPAGVPTPDYLFRGKRFDLKSPRGSGKNTLYDAIAKKAAQSENFIFDLSLCPLSEMEVSRQIELIYRSTHTTFVDVIIEVRDGAIVSIFRRKR